MAEMRPLDPPEEVEEIIYIKCDHCEDKFEDTKIVILSFGQYCKNCSDNYVENNIKEGDDPYQVNKEMKEFEQEYKLTFNFDYK